MGAVWEVIAVPATRAVLQSSVSRRQSDKSSAMPNNSQFSVFLLFILICGKFATA